MQVPDQMRDGVVFLYAQDAGQKRPAGTGFFVMRRVAGHDGRTLAVLMTAHHVIDAIRRYGDDHNVWIRVNSREGGAQWFDVPTERWLTTPRSLG